jgi:hypothetical protein
MFLRMTVRNSYYGILGTNMLHVIDLIIPFTRAHGFNSWILMLESMMTMVLPPLSALFLPDLQRMVEESQIIES